MAETGTHLPAISQRGSHVEGTAGADALPVVETGASSHPRGRPSHCEAFRAIILQKLQEQLSAQRIYQDLASDHGYVGAYDSVKRFVRRLSAVAALPMRRMECAPGAEAMLVARGIQGTRVLLGLVSLTKRHPACTLEKACEIALCYGVFRLQTLRKLIERHADAEQLPLEFLAEHPIIRPLDDYAAVVAAALERTAQRQQRDRKEEKDEEAEQGVFSGMAEQKHVAGAPNQTAPMDATTGARADLLPPRSGYPLSGCSPAEPDAVSPDHSSVIVSRSVHHYHSEDTP